VNKGRNATSVIGESDKQEIGTAFSCERVLVGRTTVLLFAHRITRFAQKETI